MKYDPRSGTGKPGMVIMIGVKGKKDKDEKKKNGSAIMKKAWENLTKKGEFNPGEPLVDEMGQPMMERNKDNRNIYDEYGLPYRMPVKDFVHESLYGNDDEKDYSRSDDYLRDTPQHRELDKRKKSGLHIDQEQLRQERPDLFDMPNPMDTPPNRKADGQEMVAGTRRSRFRSRADDPESRDAENMTQSIDSAFLPLPNKWRNKTYYTHPKQHPSESASWGEQNLLGEYYQNAPEHIRRDVRLNAENLRENYTPIVRRFDSDEYGPHTIGQKNRPDEGPEAFDVKQRLNRPFRPRSHYSKKRNSMDTRKSENPMTEAWGVLKENVTNPRSYDIEER